MERIVALVEGHTETHFVNLTYGNAIVQRPFSNGDSVSLDQIADAIIERLETIGGSIKRVVIMLDREGRQESTSEIRHYLHAKIDPHAGHRKIYIAVSSREFENWILADETFMENKFHAKDYKYTYEETKGKRILAQYNGIDAGFRDKADWLKHCSIEVARSNSASLDEFACIVDFNWPWFHPS